MLWRPTCSQHRVCCLVHVLSTAVAPGSEQEEDARDDGQSVADHCHPVAPAEVRRLYRVQIRFKGLTEKLTVFRWVVKRVVRLFG